MPIPIEQRVTSIIISLVLLLVIIQLIRKHKLREEYALIWLGAGVIILVLSVFHQVVGFMASFFAVSYAPTLILVFGLLFVLAILLSQSVALSAQANHIRDLAQDLALLKWRLRQLEEKSPQTDNSAAPKENGNSQAMAGPVAAAASNGSQPAPKARVG